MSDGSHLARPEIPEPFSPLSAKAILKIGDSVRLSPTIRVNGRKVGIITGTEMTDEGVIVEMVINDPVTAKTLSLGVRGSWSIGFNPEPVARDE